MDPLSRVNLITGVNNSGKTSVLEAVFLLAHGGNSEAAMNAHVVRGGVRGAVPPEDNAWALWGPLFSGLDVSTPIRISAVHRDLGSLRLQIKHGYSNTVRGVSASRESAGRPLGTPELHFDLKRTRGRGGGPSQSRGSARVRSQVSFETNGPPKVVHTSGQPVVAPCVILSVGLDQEEEDGSRLGQLLQRKQDHRIVEALRIIEPSLLRLWVFAGPGGHSLWADVGMSELVPLAVLGDGLKRLARLVLAISHRKSHVVLVDEIETGYHHSMLDKVWEVVHAAARDFDAQIIATTHSYDCVAAAHRTSDGENFGLHRLEHVRDATRCVTYDPESIKGAVENNLEVR